MLTHAASAQYSLAHHILDTNTKKKSQEYQVASIRVDLEDETQTIRSQTGIPFPESASLGFTENEQLVKSKLKTKELTDKVRRATHWESDTIGQLLRASVGLFATWAEESGRGDAANNSGRLHFILYLFERCNAIHAQEGSKKLDELRILEKELLWARNYKPFEPGSTNDTHFTDQVTAAHGKIRQAINIQKKEVSSTAAVTMLTKVETQTNITLGELKTYLFALPSHVRPPVVATFEAYSTNNIKFVGSAIMGGMYSVFHLDHPRETIFKKLQTQLHSLNQYLTFLGNENVVSAMSDSCDGEEEFVEEKESDHVDDFLKNQDECTVYNPETDTVCLYKTKNSGEIYRFNLTALRKPEWDKKKLSAYEIDCLMEQAKIEEINKLKIAKIIDPEPFFSIAAGITAYTKPEARLKYWVQHKRMLKSARAIQNALNVYMACKVLAKAYGDAGLFLIAQRLLEQIIGIDQDIWRNLDNNVTVSYEHFLSFEAAQVKTVTHVSNPQITQAKDTIHTQVEAAINSRNELVGVRDAVLRNLKNGKMSAKELLGQIFGIAYRYLGALATLNQLTTHELSSRRTLIANMQPDALDKAKAIDDGYKEAMQEKQDGDKLEYKSPAKKRGSLKADHNGSADSLSSASPDPSENEAPISPATSPVLSGRRSPSPNSKNSASSRDSTSVILGRVSDHKQEDDLTHPIKPLPVSVFDLDNRVLRDLAYYRRRVFDRIREKLSYESYPDNIDPVTTLVSDYNLSIEKISAEQNTSEDLFYSRLESKNKLVLALESNMIFNRFRWLPWNWWGWGRDLKTGRLVLCNEMCELFTWALVECNDLPVEKIEAMHQKIKQYLENQKQYFSYIRGAAFNNELILLQAQILKDKNQAIQHHAQLQSISDWVKLQSADEKKITPSQKLLSANDQAKLLQRLPDSALSFRVKKELKAYALSVYDEQLQEIRNKIDSNQVNPTNPFSTPAAQLAQVAGELATLKLDFDNALRTNLTDLDDIFNFRAILQDRVSQLEAELTQKTNITILAEAQAKNKETVNRLLKKVKNITKEATGQNPFAPLLSQEEKIFFLDMQQIMKKFIDNLNEEGSFEKMKQALLSLVQKDTSFSDENVSVVEMICQELNICWKPAKKTDLKMGPRADNLREIPKSSQGKIQWMSSPSQHVNKKIEGVEQAKQVKPVKQVLRVRANF